MQISIFDLDFGIDQSEGFGINQSEGFSINQSEGFGINQSEGFGINQSEALVVVSITARAAATDHIMACRSRFRPHKE